MELVQTAAFELPARLGLLVLFALIAAESAGVPLPGETALIAAGVLAADGRFEIAHVIVVAAAAAIIGDNVGYGIGRTGGRRLLERPGFLEHHRRTIIAKGEPFFEKHGPKAVFLGRWTAGLRIASAWLAGITRMRWTSFLFWNALGGVAWASSVGLLAFYIGPKAEHAFKVVGVAGGGAVLLGGVLFVLWRSLRRDRDRDRDDDAS